MDQNIRIILVIVLLGGLGLGFLLGTMFQVPAAGSSDGRQGSITPGSAPLPKDIVSFLFVQEGTGGSLVPGQNGTMILTLTGVRDDTVYFSDRPARVSGVIDTDLFIRCSMFSGNNPPNAALMIPDAPSSNDTVILTIADPLYDRANATLSYTAREVPDYHGDGLRVYRTFADPGISPTFGRAMLFIDNSDIPVDIVPKTKNAEEQNILVLR